MKSRKAFTLIELMITMAIIAILATAGIQAYTGYIKKGRDTARSQIAQNLNSSVMAYAASNGGRPPANSDEFSTFLASAGETFGGGGVSGGSLSLVDPVGGKDVCLDAEGDATQPCRFDYTAYTDGTYAISYGVEHESSKEENFYKTTASVVDGNDTPQDKYGIYIGSAPYIGSTPTTSNSTPSGGADVSYTPVGSSTPIAMASFSFRRNRIDTPIVPSGGGVSEGSNCTQGNECAAGLSCVSGICTTTSTIPVGQSCGLIGTYGTIKAKDSRCWLATNLIGHYQWGRATTAFTNSPIPPYDWSNPQDDTLWQKVGNIYKNNPCPTGSHVPTQGEWQNFVAAEGGSDSDLTNSTLQLPKAGYRDYPDGTESEQSIFGYYWYSNPSDGDALLLLFDSTRWMTSVVYPRAKGFSVRCIVD